MGRVKDAAPPPDLITVDQVPETPDAPQAPQPPQAPRRAPVAGRGTPRGIVRLGAGIAVVVLIVVLLSGSHKTRSVTAVVDEIYEIALAKPQGGLVGSWWVSAAATDSTDGRLLDFKIECGPMQFAARSARVTVNPHNNTFSFEMWDVAMAHVPESGKNDDEGTELVMRDWYRLGPLPYPQDIVPDGKEPLALGK